MASGLVIGRDSIANLKVRIVGIGDETTAENKKFRNLHKEKKKLYREKRTRNALITASEEKCQDLQMLKFGQTIDLESLDKMGSRQALDEVNLKKKKLEIRQEREIIKAKKSIALANENLIDTTQENTVQLERIAQLTHQQQTLEKELNSGGSGSGGDQGGIMRRDVEERNRLVSGGVVGWWRVQCSGANGCFVFFCPLLFLFLSSLQVQLVKLQAKEVDALKAEINMLRRKGGHVYTPAVSTAATRGGPQSGLHGVSQGSLGMDSTDGGGMGELPSR